MDTFQFDGNIVERIRDRNDARIYGELYQKYYQSLYQYCWKWVRNDTDAEDIAHESFLKAYEKLPQLKKPEFFAGWLYRIAHNLCFNHQKKGNRMGDCKTHILESQTTADLSETEQHREVLLTHLEHILEQLPNDMRQLIQARYYQGKSIDELSQEYQVGKSAIKMRLLRIRKHIHEQFDAYPDIDM